jgi:hypothetical protein
MTILVSPESSATGRPLIDRATMQLGMHFRELARMRLALALSFVLALFVAVSVTYKVSLLPPHVGPRSLEMGTASTRVLVDTQKSLVLDIRYGIGDFDSLTERGVLLGNLMASAPVREYIARRAHVPAQAIRATTPMTPDFPRPLAAEGEQKHTSDLLRSTDQYRLNIQANPTVPIIDVYAQAPSAKAAEQLANGAVDGLRDYLNATARVQDKGIGDNQPLLSQLGRAHGEVINNGVRLQVLLLAFGFVFALCCAVSLFVGRVRRGWKLADEAEDGSAGGPGDPPPPTVTRPRFGTDTT